MGFLKAQAAEVLKPITPPPSGKKNTPKARTSVALRGKPKYPRVGAPARESLDLYQVLRYPLVTESAVAMMERDNTLAFVVDARADKDMIRGAVRVLLGAEPRKVNTLVRPDGTKKAYVRLAPGFSAADVANRIGML
uniref:60S ribosomal protein L23a n=1 Tax=Anthurium amnicola TaxID=1678845 RepID=A0A1D1XRB6_9ARAE